MAKNRILFSNDFVLKNERVGINTTDPQALLDVNGTLKVSGVSTFTSISNFNNNVNIAGTVGIGTVVDIIAYDTLSNGTLSFEGSAGQLFSITNNLTSGSIFSVNDVSGIPSIDVDADGTIQLAPFGSAEYIGVGKTNPTEKLDVTGNVKVSGITTTQNLYVTGASTFIGVTTTSGDLYVGGDLYVKDDLVFDSFSANSFVVVGVATAGSYVGTSASFSQLRVSGISTFTNGPVLIGSATSTGTVAQRLQVIGGAYISNSIAIATTNPSQQFQVGSGSTIVVIDSMGELGIATALPTSKLHVVGDSLITGVTTSSRGFVGNLTGNLNSSGVNTATTLSGTTLTYTTGNLTTANITTSNIGTGIVTSISGTNLNYTGISTITNIRSTTINNTGVGTITTLNSTIGTITTLSGTNLSYSGVSTFTNGPVLIGAATSTGTAIQRLQVTGGGYVSGSVGIGTTNPQYKLHIVGDFGATTKSFVIPHPTKPGMTLRHGSLEGPENGVYVRGKTTESIISLPDYWTGLVDEESITVNLTAKNDYLHRVIKISNNQVEIKAVGGEVDCYFMILGERKDVARLEVECKNK